MGYKILGFAVWQGSKWYLKRRMSGARSRIALGVVTVAVLGGVVAAVRQAASSSGSA